MHNHFLGKLIEHGRCKLEKIGIAFHKLDKLVCFQPVGVPVLNLPLPFAMDVANMDQQKRYEVFDRIYEEGMREKKVERNGNNREV